MWLQSCIMGGHSRCLFVAFPRRQMNLFVETSTWASPLNSSLSQPFKATEYNDLFAKHFWFTEMEQCAPLLAGVAGACIDGLLYSLVSTSALPLSSFLSQST